MNIWPNEIFADNKLSPRDIMERAGTELATLTTVLSAHLQETRLPDRIVLAFIVKNDTHNLETNLFEVSYRTDKSYPILIDPPASDIPEFLQRERRTPGLRGGSFSLGFSTTAIGEVLGKTVTNEWVCATPEEFTTKLAKMLAMDHVKSSILSLLAPSLDGGDQASTGASEHQPEPEEDRSE